MPEKERERDRENDVWCCLFSFIPSCQIQQERESHHVLHRGLCAPSILDRSSLAALVHSIKWKPREWSTQCFKVPFRSIQVPLSFADLVKNSGTLPKFCVPTETKCSATAKGISWIFHKDQSRPSWRLVSDPGDFPLKLIAAHGSSALFFVVMAPPFLCRGDAGKYANLKLMWMGFNHCTLQVQVSNCNMYYVYCIHEYIRLVPCLGQFRRCSLHLVKKDLTGCAHKLLQPYQSEHILVQIVAAAVWWHKAPLPF